ncbi:hypothetical protein [Kibdelosporangium phytohabitans]|uniref:Uncharacterized protein n=1 Tax=Kibdelosporangium phytohabitans TaxID=860235 RepID=A0A0N9HJU8_9PSEU|nr:hypothetical protein [Kibdelosporangium phytohabitans]ALG06348.1 hypothetical protein AOZ06_04905 [Kibdelosporangium phytohabitans]MBE1467487.1 hypothetical protein [Kibdelosporangium phytohabitans]
MGRLQRPHQSPAASHELVWWTGGIPNVLYSCLDGVHLIEAVGVCLARRIHAQLSDTATGRRRRRWADLRPDRIVSATGVIVP